MTQKQANNVTLVIVFLAVTAVMSIFLPDKFLTVINFQSIVSQFPEYGLMALGIMLAMTTGGIDLSLISIMSISGVTAAMVLVQHASMGLPPAIVLGAGFAIYRSVKRTEALQESAEEQDTQV